MVDRKKIGLVQGVDISFLSEDAQQWVLVILEESGANISTVQSAKLKEYLSMSHYDEQDPAVYVASDRLFWDYAGYALDLLRCHYAHSQS